jgi:hypothetical protein
MPSSINFNQVLQNIYELSIEEQVYLSDLLNKCLIDIKRTEIAARVGEAEENYRSGNVQSGTVTNLMMLTNDD